MPEGIVISTEDQFSRAAAWDPDRAAIEMVSRTISYHALARSANLVARQLEAHGFRTGDIIALQGRVSPEIVTATLGCLHAGLVFLLIDPELPLAQREAMVAQARPKGVLHVGAEDETPSYGGVPALRIGFDANAGTAPAPKPGSPDLDAPAYVFFTSGTTGVPKGVLGRSGGLAQFLAWERETFAVGAQDKTSLLTGLSFDVVLRDMLLPLVSGATLCLPPPGMGRDGRSVLAWIEAAGITLMHAVPSLARSWLSAAGGILPNPTLTRSLFAGEPLTSALVGEWRARFPNAEVVNLYGPTETTLAKFFYRVPTEPAQGIQAVGRPLPETQAVILDPGGLAPLAQGAAGLVGIRTRYPSLGYLNAAREQAARFVDLPGGPTYLTGDLGFIDHDGLLHLAGRMDHQVKINGVRVEPDGVAARLQEHPAVRNAAVIAQPSSGRGDPSLVAYYVPDDPAAGDLSRDLRDYLADRLPSAMIPGLFVGLAAFPLTANGKLDRKALALSQARHAPFVAPRDPLEATVLSAWTEVLRREDLGVEHDFFAAGGDSLAAAEICALLTDALGGVVEPRLLVTHATPARLAAHLRNAPRLDLPALPVAEDRDRYRLSPQQRRYYATFVEQENRSWCNMVAEIPLPPTADRESVATALRRIAARHDSLRLRFVRDGGEIRQEYGPDRPIEVAQVDLSPNPERERPAAVLALRIEEGERVIPVDRWPLFRATLIHVGPHDRRLLWNIHHLGSDGRSQGLLAAELKEILWAAAEGRVPELPALPRQYRDFSEWYNSPYGPAAVPGHRSYWRSLHAEPYRRPHIAQYRDETPTARAHALKFVLPDTLTASIRSAARDLRTTPFIILISGYVGFCHALCGTDDMVVATPIAGRDHPDVAHLIGNFISLITVRSRLSPDASFADLVARMRTQVPEGAAHQAFQYDELMAELGHPMDPDRFPLTTFSMNYMPVPGQPVGTRERMAHDLGFEVKYDLLLMVRDYSDAIAFEFQYRSAVFTPDEAEALAARYVSGLAASLAAPTAILDRTAGPELASVTARVTLPAASLAGAPRRTAAPTVLSEPS
ncbi:AMP-binding protein [Arenibaculum sp.]|uniref:AMP-binding protein n=1 Tax=Arenibaculum sp. TaxID=2865862 RepID=UPI002E11FED4|nr:AMP-binding protein [Arenibaculum sp.]